MVHNETRAVKLIDFGISKKTYQRGTRREMLTVTGTQYYIAPEIFMGGGYDERVDLWALGVTLYRVVTKVTPFEAEYRSETIRNILEGNVTFEDDVWDEHSPSLRRFIDGLLKNADERMSLTQAKRHFWLQTRSDRSLRRTSSEVILVHESFHAEMNAHKNSLSKEEGQ